MSTDRSDRDPWPYDWESRPAVDLCRHDWEIHITPSRPSGKPEPVARCRICHTPRCGHTTDPDPCMERRHHDGLHIHQSGCFEPVGGNLRHRGDPR